MFQGCRRRGYAEVRACVHAMWRLTSQEWGLQEPPVLFRQRPRLSIGVADLVVAVDPDLASIQPREHEFQNWRLTLRGSSNIRSCSSVLECSLLV